MRSKIFYIFIAFVFCFFTPLSASDDTGSFFGEKRKAFVSSGGRLGEKAFDLHQEKIREQVRTGIDREMEARLGLSGDKPSSDLSHFSSEDLATFRTDVDKFKPMSDKTRAKYRKGGEVAGEAAFVAVAVPVVTAAATAGVFLAGGLFRAARWAWEGLTGDSEEVKTAKTLIKSCGELSDEEIARRSGLPVDEVRALR